MNYLAHAYLSGEDEQLLVGNFIGDFVKGDPQKLDLPPQITEGIRLHRKIDAFCETHPYLSSAKAYLPEQQKRYVSIILDILNDHFLAKNWFRYNQGLLTDFTKNIYQIIDKYQAILPAAFQYTYQFIKRDDWLTGYCDIDLTIYALERMSYRLKKPLLLQATLSETLQYYNDLEADFHSFFIETQNYAVKLL